MRFGLFPFRLMELSPHSLTPELHLLVFGVWLRWVPCGPIPIQCSTPSNQRSRLALKLFRGEPAIAEFDWNFSANHNSSPSVAQLVGSVLPSVCHRSSTWSWLDHPASGLVQATHATRAIRAINPRFHCASTPSGA